MVINDLLLKKYLEYAASDEAKAVLFVKKYLNQAKNHWIDIIFYDRYYKSDNDLYFRFVECALFWRKMKPEYLPKENFITNGEFDERLSYIMNRAITWETAHADIDNQKNEGFSGKKYQIRGVYYNKNWDKYSSQPPWLDPESPFYGDSPSSFSWRERRYYTYDPEWVYEIKGIKRVN
jgi:hypothetical protein